MDYGDKELLNFVIQSIKSYARSKRAVFVTFDPSICLSQSLINQEKTEFPENLAIIDSLQQMGVRWSGKNGGNGRHHSTSYSGENIQGKF